MRAPSRIVGAALGLCALALVVLPSTSGADRIGRLRVQRAALALREQSALLQLYALSTSLDRARGRLVAVDGALRAAGRRRDEALVQLGAAKRTLAAAEALLGAQVRAIYERDQSDVSTVLFGATSLEDVITGIDEVDRTTTSTRDLIAQAAAARAGVARTLASLTRRTAALARLRQQAADAASVAASARDQRAAYIAGLRTQERLTGEEIARLESRARAAEAASTVVTVHAEAAKSLSVLESRQAPGGQRRDGGHTPAPPASTRAAPAAQPPAQPTSQPTAQPAAQPTAQPAAPTTPAAPAAAPASVQPAAGSGSRLTVVATAYSLHGGTASGLPTGVGVVAVDPTVIPLGTRLFIPGYGPGIAADTGTAIKGLRIDLWFPTLAQAESWGRRTVTITLR